MAKYNVKLSVQDKSTEFSADTVTELLLLFANKLYQLNGLQENKSNSSDEAAKKLIDKYNQRFVKADNRCHSLIHRAGLDIDVARCYLNGMSIYETVDWLRIKKGCRTSKTAIGRYWVKFAQVNCEENAI